MHLYEIQHCYKGILHAVNRLITQTLTRTIWIDNLEFPIAVFYW